MSCPNRLGNVCPAMSAAVMAMTIVTTLLVPATAGADAVHYGYVWKRNANGKWEDKANWNCINPAGGNCSTDPAENRGYPSVAGDEAFINGPFITQRLTISVGRNDIRVAKIFLPGVDINIQQALDPRRGQIILNSGSSAPAEIVTSDRAIFNAFGTDWSVPLVNESPLIITTGANARFDLATDVGPFDNGVTVRGPGETIFQTHTTYTGPTTVESGLLTLANAGAMTPTGDPSATPTVLSRDLVVGPGAAATIRLPHQLIDSIHVTVNSGVFNVLAADQIADLTLDNGTVFVQQVGQNRPARFVTSRIAIDGGTMTVRSGGHLQLNGDVTVGSRSGVITYDTSAGSIIGGLELGDGQHRFTLNGSLDVAIPVLGTGGLIEQGPGTLFLGDGPLGPIASTYAGGTRVVEGNVVVVATSVVFPSALVIGHDGPLAQVFLHEAGVSSTTAASVGPFGNLVVRAPSATMGSLAIFRGGRVVQNLPDSSNLLQIQSTLDMSGGGDLDIQQGSLWVVQRLVATSGPMQTPVIRGAGRLLAPPDILVSDGPQAVDLRISADMLNGLSGPINKDQNGVLELAGTNIFSNLTILNGTVLVGAGSAIPLFATLTLSNPQDAAIVDLNNFDLIIASLNGNGGRVRIGSRTLSLASPTGSTAVYGGIIEGTGQLVKAGAGTQTLAGSRANTFTGRTTVQAGTLVLGKSIQKGTILGPALVNSGTLSMAADNQFGDAADCHGECPRRLRHGGTLGTIASLSGNGEVRLGIGTLSLGTGRSAVFSGTMTGATAPVGLPPERYIRLIKIGLSTVTLTGTLNLGDQALVDRGVLTLDTQLNGRGVIVRIGAHPRRDRSHCGPERAVGDDQRLDRARSWQSRHPPRRCRRYHGRILDRPGHWYKRGHRVRSARSDRSPDAQCRGASPVAAYGDRAARQHLHCREGRHDDAGQGAFNSMPEGATFSGNGQTFRITYRGGDGNDVVVTALDGPPGAPATSTYYLPEGATGPLVDEDVLIGNPNDAPAPVTLVFTKASGEQIVETRTVPALSRLTVHVDEIPGLESTRVSTEVRSDF